jgi:uncharacterized membrane protein (DUF2068 family)
MNRKLSVRIASILLILHGLIELAGLVFINSMPHALISFGGLTGPALKQNAATIAILGALWGIARLIAAVGAWSLRKWALILGISLSTITLVAAIMIIPAGVTDTVLALPTLTLLLYAWFGNEIKEAVGG